MNPVYGYLERFAGWFTDVILAVSQSERDGLNKSRVLSPRQLFHVTAGIDTAAYTGYVAPAQLREELGLPRNAVVVGSAGRLVSHKDPFTFLNVGEDCYASQEAIRILSGLEMANCARKCGRTNPARQVSPTG